MAEESGGAPQSMWIWAGQEVIICCRGTAHGLRHNTRNRIKEISAEYILLDSGVRLTYELASKHLRPPYACTSHSAQGLEFKGLLHLTDLQSPRLTRAHLLVGMSRATDSSLLQLG